MPFARPSGDSRTDLISPRDIRHDSALWLSMGRYCADDASMGGGKGEAGGKYTASPLARHDKALKTAAALLLLEVAPATINFELRRQFGYSEGEAAAVIREAVRSMPRPTRARKPRSRNR
jgi:hypothetical protein